MAELISSNSIGFDPDRGYENCNCLYDLGNGQIAQQFQPCPCSSTPTSVVGNNNNSNNINNSNMYNPNNPNAGNSMALQQADLGQGQLVNTARGLRFMRYPSVARMKPVSLYARPSSPVTPKVSATRELARRKRNPMLNFNVARKRTS